MQLNTSCHWFYPVATNSSSDGWIQVMADLGSGGCIRVAADSVPRLTQVLVTGCELQLTPSHHRLEFRWLDMSYNWLHPTTDSSSGGWIWLKADSILWLTWVPVARYELQLILSCSWLEFYTLTYKVNLRTYPAKYIIFMVCFLRADFSYHWSRLWLLLQEPWRSVEKLQNPSCDWF